MIKYASNAFLATKISFINEISKICEKVKADVQEVTVGMNLDHRKGPHFLNVGLGYGGLCFPKDISSLLYQAKLHGNNAKLLKSVKEVNCGQIT